MAQVVNWLLKVKDQKKVEETGNVRMNCLMNGQKKQDGSYCDGMWITVIIARTGDKATKWDKPADYTGKYIEVSGNFTHGDWEKDGKKGKNFTIFASEVKEHIFEERNNNGGGGNKY